MIDTKPEHSNDTSPVARVDMHRSTNFGRRYRAVKDDLPRVTAHVDIPPELVDDVRELHQYYQNSPRDVPPPEQSFTEYLHDVVLEQLTIELRYPENSDPGETPDG